MEDRDLWKTESEKGNSMRHGITYIDGYTDHCIKLQTNASDKDDTSKQDKAIADTYESKFVIPLDF